MTVLPGPGLHRRDPALNKWSHVRMEPDAGELQRDWLLQGAGLKQGA
jgi:hypothetical protein